MAELLPLVLPAEQLQQQLDNSHICIVDVSSPASYIQQHVPGAFFLPYEWIVTADQPRMGLIPAEQQLNRVFGALGIDSNTHVVAYDDEGGGRAARLLYTLEVAGHAHYSLLDGGIHAWVNSGKPVSTEIHYPENRQFEARCIDAAIATRQYILDHLDDDNVVILDTRSPAEYRGDKVFAQRGGHIPGAINIEWTEAMDKQHDLRLKPEQELRNMLETQGITPDKTVVTHCHTHHRSAHTWLMLKSLGYDKVKGYPGSWSDWGNQNDTPIEK